MAARKSAKSTSLLARLAKGPVICAEGYLFEFERRGYLQAGAYVPEIVLEHPDLVSSEVRLSRTLSTIVAMRRRRRLA